MAALKNIIFDLGGVLLDIDYKKTEDAFIRLGYDHFHQMYSQFTADELFRKLETGKVSDDEFYRVLAGAHAGAVTKDQIKEAWNMMLLKWRESSLLFLEKISSKFNIYLLSNTNAIHFDAFHISLKEQTGRNAIDPLFKKAYWSHRIGYRKPDATVFEFLMQDAGFTASETLLVDDSVNNIEAAAALGFKTKLLLPGEHVEDISYQLF